MPRKLIPTEQLLGSKYGRLTIIEDLGKVGYCRKVIAKCICGIVKQYSLNGLRMGDTQSCGCLNKELISARSRTHGLSNHLLYGVWMKMRQRCLWENDPQYSDYGGRGITIISEWKEDFKQFYEWCMSHGWEVGLTIDRRDNDGNYSPDNCRIADDYVQAQNKRNNRNFEFDGEIKCLKEWCRIYNRRYKLTHQRIYRDNWSFRDAVITTEHFE